MPRSSPFDPQQPLPAAREPHSAAAAIRAAGYENHFAAQASELDGLFYPARERIVIESLSAVGDEAAADFNDQSSSAFKLRIHRTEALSVLRHRMLGDRLLRC